MKIFKDFKSVLRTLLYWGVIAFFIYLVSKSIGDYGKVFETAKQADFVSLGWIMVLAIGNLSVMTAIFRANMLVFEQEVQAGKLLPEIMAFSFVTVSNPLGANGAGAYVISRLVSTGHSYLKTLFSFLSTQLSLNVAFFPILGFALWYLSSNQILSQTEITASIILLVTNLGMLTVIFFLLILPKFSISVADFVSDIANLIAKKILRKSLINSRKISNGIKDIQNTSQRFDTTSVRFSKAIFFALVFHFINLTILFLSFKAYGLVPDLQVLACVYSIIFLFTAVSPTPQGIGIVEGFAHLGAIAVGVESENALVVVLTYRAMTIWLPAILGFLIFRTSKKQHATDAS